MDGKGIYLDYGKAMERILEVPVRIDEIETASKQGAYKLVDKAKLDATHVRENGKLMEINDKIARFERKMMTQSQGDKSNSMGIDTELAYFQQ